MSKRSKTSQETVSKQSLSERLVNGSLNLNEFYSAIFEAYFGNVRNSLLHKLVIDTRICNIHIEKYLFMRQIFIFPMRKYIFILFELEI